MAEEQKVAVQAEAQQPAENKNSTRIHECCSVPFQDRKKDAIGAPDTAVFSCRYSFEHVHFNIYGFTAQ